ncbi:MULTISPECIES: hypothetical protein [Mesobacillus]|uniref:Uncharacterized protein n=2 Tax=Mesobacillus TaxID=2675231 RepID=A0A0D6ZD90_9BACI|nr:MULTISPECIES: hypothetical protein [Mesobacillus]KIY23764.1 hypothetical protein UB32_01240 [Mesobacillus subterraneus]MDQ0413368.1 dolichol kinase [Mesobacillus stamsii]
MNFYKILGIVLIIISGLIYTLERGFTVLSTSIVRAGFYSGRMTGEVPNVEASGILDNFYVPLFLAFGVLLIIYWFKRKG